MVLIVVAGNILMYVAMFNIVSTLILSNSYSRKRRSNMSLVTFFVCLAMFIMDTAIFFIDINNAVKELSYTLTSNWDLPFEDRMALLDNLPWPVESALYAFMVRFTFLVHRSPIYDHLSKVKSRRCHCDLAGLCLLLSGEGALAPHNTRLTPPWLFQCVVHSFLLRWAQ